MKKIIGVLLLLAMAFSLNAMTFEQFVYKSAQDKLNKQNAVAMRAIYDRMYNIPELKTQDEVLKWVARSIEYKSDEKEHGTKDYWQTPEETLMRRAGDCEDFSILAMFMLARLGIYSEMALVDVSKVPYDYGGHAIIWIYEGKPYDVRFGYYEPQWGMKVNYTHSLNGHLTYEQAMYTAYVLKSLNPIWRRD